MDNFNQSKKSFFELFLKSIKNSLKETKNNIEKTAIQQPVISLAFGIFVAIGIIFILIYGIQDITATLLLGFKSVFLNKQGIFYNIDGNFEWVGVTSLVAIVTLYINALYNKRKFRADLVSQSRIAWLNTTRKITTEVITCSNEIAIAVNTIISNYVDVEDIVSEKKVSNKSPEETKLLLDEQRQESLIQLNKAKRKLFEKIVLFKMYFGNNEENNRIVSIAENIEKKCNDLIDVYDDFAHNSVYESAMAANEKLQAELENTKRAVECFGNECRQYFKNEWDKAKAGK